MAKASALLVIDQMPSQIILRCRLRKLNLYPARSVETIMKRAKSAFHFLRKVIESVLARESLPDKATSLKKQKTKNKEKTIRSKNND